MVFPQKRPQPDKPEPKTAGNVNRCLCLGLRIVRSGSRSTWALFHASTFAQLLSWACSYAGEGLLFPHKLLNWFTQGAVASPASTSRLGKRTIDSSLRKTQKN